MTYPALPDMRIPYDNDGTVMAYGSTFDGQLGYPTGAQEIGWQGLATNYPSGMSVPATHDYGCWWMFFPEQREVTGYWTVNVPQYLGSPFYQLQGSNDTTNGVDGTWETASTSAAAYTTLFDWRSGIKTVSFTGPKKVIRMLFSGVYSNASIAPYALHLYGAKGTGQTPDDIIYLDADNADAPFTAPIDFGDIPLGTSAIRHFKVQNTSATKTANTINIQCNDSDFIISSDGVTWVVTINIASLAAGAKSGTLYVRDTAPNPGGRLGPRFARIVTTVASYT